MPITLQPATLKYKNGQGVFQSADCLKGDPGPKGAKGDKGDPGQNADPAELIDDTTPAADKTFSSSKLSTDLNSLSNALNQKQEKPETTGQAGQVLGLALVDGQLVPVWITPASGGGDVTDVQINGNSILDAQGVANIPKATSSALGLVIADRDYGIGPYGSQGRIQIICASDSQIKNGATAVKAIVPIP